MKIIHANFTFYPSTGGTENEVYQYSHRLVKRGHNVTVITSNLVGYRQQKLPREEIIDGIKVIRFPVIFPYPFSKLLITPTMIWKLTSLKAELIHVFSFIPHFFTNYIALYAIQKRIPLIYSPIYHPARQSVYKGLLAFLQTNIYEKWLGLKILKRTDYVTALIPSEAHYYKEQGIRNVRVKGLGVDDEINFPPQELEQFKRRYGLEDSKVLISLSRLEWRKGIQHIIRAMPLILKTNQKVKLLVAGEDMGYRKALETLCNKLKVQDWVVFTGDLERRQAHCALKVSDIFLLPSHYDVLPLAPLEAWIYKKPVILSSKVWGQEDLVTPETGITIQEPSDYKALANAVWRLLSDPEKAKAIGENGYRMVKRQFSWDSVVDRIEDMYKATTTKTR